MYNVLQVKVYVYTLAAALLEKGIIVNTGQYGDLPLKIKISKKKLRLANRRLFFYTEPYGNPSQPPTPL